MSVESTQGDVGLSAVPAAPPPVKWNLRTLLELAVFTGILAGFAQVLASLIMNAVRLRARTLGWNMLWMTPLTTAALFVVVGLVVAAVGRLNSRLWRPSTALAAFGFLGVLGVSLYKGGVHPIADTLVSLGGASVLLRVLGPRMGSFLAFVRRTAAPLTGLVAVLAVVVCAAPVISERLTVRRLGPPASHINVLLIILDAVRAQDLGLYGYHRPTTPNLEQWAGRAIVFRKALSPSSWSLPSHASMFTGRPPLQLSADWTTPLDDEYPTVAEYLGDRGYVTAGFAANPSYCHRVWGLARGFAHYEDNPLNLEELLASSRVVLDVINHSWVRRLTGYYDFLGRKNAAKINRDFLSWIDRRPPRPFFAFLNYFDAHEPVVPPPELAGRFPSPAPRRWDILDHQLHQALRTNPERLSPPELQAEVDAYDAAITELDRRVSELLHQLDGRGLLDSTVVFITADHGERHGENGKFGHGGGLSRLLVHVPLLVLVPDRRTGAVEEFVSLRDVAATALDLAGVPNDGTFRPCSFGRLKGSGVTEAAREACRPATVEVPNRGKPWTAAFQDHFYFVARPTRVDLYDWDTDPSARNSLVGDSAYAEIIAAFRKTTDSLVVADRR